MAHGGVVTSAILELLIYPAIYVIWRWQTQAKKVAEVREVKAGETQPVLER